MAFLFMFAALQIRNPVRNSLAATCYLHCSTGHHNNGRKVPDRPAFIVDDSVLDIRTVCVRENPGLYSYSGYAHLGSNLFNLLEALLDTSPPPPALQIQPLPSLVAPSRYLHFPHPRRMYIPHCPRLYLLSGSRCNNLKRDACGLTNLLLQEERMAKQVRPCCARVVHPNLLCTQGISTTPRDFFTILLGRAYGCTTISMPCTCRVPPSQETPGGFLVVANAAIVRLCRNIPHVKSRRDYGTPPSDRTKL